MDAERSPQFAGLETRACATDAYGRSIKPFHGMFLSRIFGAMMGQVPSRKRFLAEMAKPHGGEPAATQPSDADVYLEMRAFVEIFEPIVDALHTYIVDLGLDDPWKA